MIKPIPNRRGRFFAMVIQERCVLRVGFIDFDSDKRKQADFALDPSNQIKQDEFTRAIEAGSKWLELNGLDNWLIESVSFVWIDTPLFNVVENSE